MKRSDLEPGDMTKIANVVKHIFGMQNPWKRTGRIIKEFDNMTWAMWNLVLLNHRINNPGDDPPLTTVLDKWRYLEWLRANPRYTFRGIDFDCNRKVDDYYKMIGLKLEVKGSGMQSFKSVCKDIGNG